MKDSKYMNVLILHNGTYQRPEGTGDQRFPDAGNQYLSSLANVAEKQERNYYNLTGGGKLNQERLKERFAEYKKAVRKLKEALDEYISNPLLYDGVIQASSSPMNWHGN